MRTHRITRFVATAFGVIGVSAPASSIAQNAVMPGRQVVDGIVMLHHRPDAFDRAPRWSLAPTPLATAGGASDPDFDLTYVHDVELLSDGRLVTLSPIGSRLLLFEPDGRGEASLTRQGKGPGELMSARAMAKSGDTLVLIDRANARVNWVVPGKGFVVTRPFAPPLSLAAGLPIGALRGGAIVVSTADLVQRGLPDSVTRPAATVGVLSADGSSARVLTTIPDLEVALVPARFRGRPSTETLVLRFTRKAHVAVWDTVIATGSGDGYRIDLRDANGRVHTILRVAVPRRPVTKAMREAALSAAMRQFEGPRAERMVDPAESRRLEEITPVADSLPPYGEWFVSANGTLWILDGASPIDMRRAATAFRGDGAIVGRLTWSGTRTPMAFGDDRVVMRETDADGVVSLRVYRIIR